MLFISYDKTFAAKLHVSVIHGKLSRKDIKKNTQPPTCLHVYESFNFLFSKRPTGTLQDYTIYEYARIR